MIALVVVTAFAVTDHKPTGDPTVPVLHLFAWMLNIGALGIILLMAAASVAVIAFFVRRSAGRAQIWRLMASGLACLALLTIAVLTVKDFDVPGRGGPWLAAEPATAWHPRSDAGRRPSVRTGAALRQAGHVRKDRTGQ